jgi:uncharacterized protein YlxW (UPF0749 family)
MEVNAMKYRVRFNTQHLTIQYPVTVFILSISIILSICIFTVLNLGCDGKDKSETTPTPVTPASTTYATQKQVNDLNAVITTMQSQINSLVANSSGAETTKALADLRAQANSVNATLADTQNALTSLTTTNTVTAASVEALTTTVNALKSQITSIQQTLSANTTVIGSKPVNINGLSVTFLTYTTYLSTTAINTATSTQLAVKISNTTGHDITNLDIIGALTFSQYYFQFADNYPKLTDGAGTASYTQYYNGSTAINFEAYSTGSGKTLTIPKNSSITLRPRVELKVSNMLLASTVTLTLSTISYDTTS